ncbi:MAG: CBS domain-containing protein [Actinobacteria bacterium]|nr:CBS domain-containing protein [Actinomycetota bacterium]MDQ3533642.1 CBS domain-containing protein [Actinomycetota bacterium]
MSPRAAWQLETMGFTEVYDFVDGKIAWMVNGLPVEGKGPHFSMAGEVASKKGVHDCVVGSTVQESAREMEARGDSFCLVLNDEGIVLGRLREKHLDRGSSALVETVMETGPTTVRPIERAKPLLERMDKHNVSAMVVTTKKGKLVGVARRKDLRRLVEESG